MVQDKEAEKLISDIIERIVREYKPRSVILFGSYA